MPRLQSSTRPSRLMGVLAALVLTAASAPGPPCGRRRSRGPGAAQRVNPDAKAIAEFQEEVAEYLELAPQARATLPALPKDASPEADRRAPAGAGPADSAGPEERGAGRHLRRATHARCCAGCSHGLFTGPDGKRLRDAIMEENPGRGREARRQRPLPRHASRSRACRPQILQALPPLPEELEYRFIQTTLILLDVHAHIIVDYLTGAVPR